MAILSNHLRMAPAHVDEGMVNMRPAKEVPESSGLWNCIRRNCFLRNGNIHQSSRAKPGEYSGQVTRFAPFFDQEVESGCRSVRACIVVVEKQAFGSMMWAAPVPLLEDLGQVAVDILIGTGRLPVLESYGQI